jgi:tetratricopeptide (TPR) repeat protein
MLKNLLSELGKSLRRGDAGATTVVDPLEGWRTEFRRADPTRREALMAAVDAWITAHPQRKQGWTLRGDWRLQLGALDDAEQDYRKALQIDPLSPGAQEGLGLALLHAGRLDDAYLHLEMAHKLKPMDADILNHWGLVALEMGNLGDARAKFERAVERDIRNPHTWHNLGLVATKLGRPVKGIEYLRRAIELKSDHGLAYSNIALAYRDAEQLDESLAAARRAVELKAGNSRVWVVLGDVLIDAGEFEESERALENALQLNAGDHTALIALGKLHAASGRHKEAELAYRDALALSPGNAEAQGGLGQLELLLGRFEAGWDDYEARRRSETAPVRDFPFLEWDGGDLAGRTVLVHAEQGLGDLILFASCLPDLMTRAGHVVVETYPRLAALFERSFPGATVVGRDVSEPGIDWLRELPPIERHVAAGSLPRWLRRHASAFPRHTGYLRADDERVAALSERLAALGQGPALGIAWRGGLLRSAGAQRSLPLEELLRTLAPFGMPLVSLQYGDVGAEVEAAAHATGVPVHHWPELLIDQDDAAALTSAVAAVITVCQTQAHLTGALGRPGCVLVPTNPNWRYGAAGDATPWYPSLHLARQSRVGDWSGALAGVATWVRGLPRLHDAATGARC